MESPSSSTASSPIEPPSSIHGRSPRTPSPSGDRGRSVERPRNTARKPSLVPNASPASRGTRSRSNLRNEITQADLKSPGSPGSFTFESHLSSIEPFVVKTPDTEPSSPFSIFKPRSESPRGKAKIGHSANNSVTAPSMASNTSKRKGSQASEVESEFRRPSLPYADQQRPSSAGSNKSSQLTVPNLAPAAATSRPKFASGYASAAPLLSPVTEAASQASSNTSQHRLAPPPRSPARTRAGPDRKLSLNLPSPTAVPRIEETELQRPGTAPEPECLSPELLTSMRYEEPTPKIELSSLEIPAGAFRPISVGFLNQRPVSAITALKIDPIAEIAEGAANTVPDAKTLSPTSTVSLPPPESSTSSNEDGTQTPTSVSSGIGIDTESKLEDVLRFTEQRKASDNRTSVYRSKKPANLTLNHDTLISPTSPSPVLAIAKPVSLRLFPAETPTLQRSPNLSMRSPRHSMPASPSTASMRPSTAATDQTQPIHPPSFKQNANGELLLPSVSFTALPQPTDTTPVQFKQVEVTPPTPKTTFTRSRSISQPFHRSHSEQGTGTTGARDATSSFSRFYASAGRNKSHGTLLESEEMRGVGNGSAGGNDAKKGNTKGFRWMFKAGAAGANGNAHGNGVVTSQE